MNATLKLRCSALHKIIGDPRTKGEGELSQTARSYLHELARENLFGYRAFDGNKYTEKGKQLEEQAIKLSGLTRGTVYKKNLDRKENDFITGECDIFDPKRKLIIDTKCTWDIGSHPFFANEAEKKAKEQGYDIQMQGYLWLWEAERAEIDFWLLPTPLDLIGNYDSVEQHIDLVEQIPQKHRIQTVVIERDEKLIAKIQQKATACQAYYAEITARYITTI